MRYLPFIPKKAQAFRFYFALFDDGVSNLDQDNISGWGFSGVSKDGGAFVSLTNSPVLISSGDVTQREGFGYVDLTASEMNANVICLALYPSGESVGDASRKFIIYTDGYSGFSNPNDTSTTVMDFISSAKEKFYKIVKKAVNESGYNYYGITGDTNNKWYIIIREQSNGTLSIGYYMNRDNRLSFDSAWSGRASLSYSSVQPKI